MKKSLMTAAAVAALAGFGPVAAQAAAPVKAVPNKPMAMKTVTRAEVTQKVQDHFAKVDSNSDGFVTKAEADAGAQDAPVRIKQRREKGGTAMFDRLDTNKDGAISRAELEAGHQHHAGKLAMRGGKRGMHHAGFGSRMFERADADKDGRVSIGEATAAATARFDAADSNRDGTLTPDEMRQARQKMKANAPRS